jgi:hypothetical protein
VWYWQVETEPEVSSLIDQLGLREKQQWVWFNISGFVAYLSWLDYEMLHPHAGMTYFIRASQSCLVACSVELGVSAKCADTPSLVILLMKFSLSCGHSL